jgi:H-type lectin domain
METVTAIATLGASSAGTPVAEPGTKGTFRYTVKFTVPFASAPIVVATPLQGTNFGQNIADAFAVTVTAVTTENFTVSVNRLDALNQGWDQNLRLQYMASV